MSSDNKIKEEKAGNKIEPKKKNKKRWGLLLSVALVSAVSISALISQETQWQSLSKDKQKEYLNSIYYNIRLKNTPKDIRENAKSLGVDMKWLMLEENIVYKDSMSELIFEGGFWNGIRDLMKSNQDPAFKSVKRSYSKASNEKEFWETICNPPVNNSGYSSIIDSVIEKVKTIVEAVDSSIETKQEKQEIATLGEGFEKVESPVFLEVFASALIYRDILKYAKYDSHYNFHSEIENTPEKVILFDSKKEKKIQPFMIGNTFYIPLSLDFNFLEEGADNVDSLMDSLEKGVLKVMSLYDSYKATEIQKSPSLNNKHNSHHSYDISSN